MDDLENKPMQAPCPAIQGLGVSFSDMYMRQHRAESYHKVLKSVPREGMPQSNAWAATRENEGCRGVRRVKVVRDAL